MKRTDEYLAVVNKVQQFIKKKKLLNNHQKLIIGISGGIDSVTLLDILLHLRKIYTIEVILAHVNYRLRGQESDNDEKFVRELAVRHGLPCFIHTAETKKLQRETKQTLQETARNIRYSFFDNLKKSLKADRIVTAHTADDNAETMLLNLFRGSGLEGMTGIPVCRGDIIRPLLCVTRKEIVEYGKSRKLKFREDSSNKKDDYTRNFVRHKIVPAITKRINPSLAETLLETSEIFDANAHYVNKEIDSFFPNIVDKQDDLYRISVHPIQKEDLFIQQMIAHRILSFIGCEPSFRAINSLLDLLENQKGKRFEISKEWDAERLEHEILITKKINPKEFSFSLNNEGTIAAENFIFSIKKSPVPGNKAHHHPSIEYVDASRVHFPIVVRSWCHGDAFVPLGMKGTKKLSDFFADQKLSSKDKKTIPVIESGSNIMWIAGYRLDDRFKLTQKTKNAYQLTITALNGKKNSNRK